MGYIKYKTDDNVFHESYGAGQVIVDNGNSVVVRFETVYQKSY